jgi:hypothetical protein
MSNPPFKIKIYIFLTYSLPHLHMQHADVRGSSISEQLYIYSPELSGECSFPCSYKVLLQIKTTQKHLEENQFHALSGGHMTKCPPTESSCQENAFGVLQHIHCRHKIHIRNITIFIVWKYKRCHYEPSQLTVTMTTAECEILVWTGWRIALLGYLLKERPVQCTDNTSCQTGTVCRSTRPHFSHVTISVTVQLYV